MARRDTTAFFESIVGPSSRPFVTDCNGDENADDQQILLAGAEFLKVLEVAIRVPTWIAQQSL